MSKKPRENRVPIMMSDAELDTVDDWRFRNRVATRSEAVRRLCKLGQLIGSELPRGLQHAVELHKSFQALEKILESDKPPTQVEFLRARLNVAEEVGYLLEYHTESMLLLSLVTSPNAVDDVLKELDRDVKDFAVWRENRREALAKGVNPYAKHGLKSDDPSPE